MAEAEPTADVRVGIVSYNTAALLDDCLAALPAALDGLVAEVVVVDNGSTDGSADVAIRHEGVTVVRNDDNVGYPRAMNRALGATGARVVIALNPDTVAPPGSLRRLVERIDHEPRTALVSPLLTNTDGSVQHSVHRFPSARVALVMGVVPHALRRGALGRRYWLEGFSDLDRAARVDWTVGAVHAIRRAALPDPDHAYPERWFMYAEDLGLCWALTERGWDVVFDPTVSVTHVGNAAGAAAFGAARAARVLDVEHQWYRTTHGPLATRAWVAATVAGLAAKLSVLTALRRDEEAREVHDLLAIHRRHWAGDGLGPFPILTPLPAEPLVSVCVTNHDYEAFVVTAVESALVQTYPNLEVLVVDDASTDGSVAALRAFGDRINLIVQADNRGQAAAGARALDAARGDVVLFLDADDWLDNTAVATAVEAFRADPSAVLVQWRMRTVDESGADLRQDRPPRAGLLPSGDLRDQMLRTRNWPSQLTSGVAYRTDVIRRLQPVRLPPGEANALERPFNTLAPFFGTVRSLDGVHSAYRVHASSASSAAALDGRYPRRLIQLTAYGHDDACRVARELGLPDPGGVDDPRDPAFFGWRLWSLRVEPARHPWPADRAAAVAARGVWATLAHPQFPLRHKLKRAAWFLAMVLVPRRFTGRVLQWYVPDGPRVVAGDVIG